MMHFYLPPGLIDKAKKTFGSHAKVARAIGIPCRTYADWRLRGFRFAKAQERSMAKLTEIINGI